MMNDLDKSSPHFRLVALIIIVAHVGATLMLACLLEVNYYDGYEYSLAARALLDGTPNYPPNRQPLLSLILAPMMWLASVRSGMRSSSVLPSSRAIRPISRQRCRA